MKNDWIIDVLTDLQRFSQSNSMGKLAEGLDDAIALAAHELSQADMPMTRVSEIEQTRGHAGRSFKGQIA